MEAVSDGCAVAQPLGAVHQGEGGDAAPDAYSGGAVVGGRGRRQEAGAAQLHFTSSDPGPLSRGQPRARGAAGPRSRPRLSPRRDLPGDVRTVAILTTHVTGQPIREVTPPSNPAR